MEFTVTLDYGPLHAEFTGDNREEMESDLLKFTEFLEENSHHFNGIEYHSDDSDSSNPSQSSVTQDWGVNPDTSTGGNASSKFEGIAQRARTNPAVLNQFLQFPEEDDKVPYLRLDDFENEEDVLGSSRMEKHARASLMLLYLWQELGRIEEVESAELNKALQTSRINPKSRKNMYKALDGEADGFFTRDNQGNVGLTQAGEIAAVDQISDLAEQLQ